MERLYDKIMLLGAMLVVGMAFASRASTVVCLLAGVTATLLVEACRMPAYWVHTGRDAARPAVDDDASSRRERRGHTVMMSRLLRCLRNAVTWLPTLLPLSVCALAFAVPEALFALPFATYDLARSSQRAWLVVPALALLAAWRTADLPVAAKLLVAGCAIVAYVLSRRTERTAVQRRAIQQERDDLAARSRLLEVQNRELRDKRELEVRVAVLEERSRIAREIHDNVGHLLTRAHLQAQAYQVVFAKDDKARAAFATLGESLTEALDTVRASVHDLHDEHIDLAAQIERIAAESGLPVLCRLEATVAPPEVAACLRAVAREALSNVARHAKAREVSLSLVEHPGFWQLTIENDGACTSDGAPGLGLVSLEERVQALGGTFRAGPIGEGAQPSSWRVFVSIPKKREAQQEA